MCKERTSNMYEGIWDDIRSLEDGWFDDDPKSKHGVKIPEEVIQKAKNIVELLQSETVEIFPLADGGIQLEWGDGSNGYFEMEIHKDNIELLYLSKEEYSKIIKGGH